MAAPADNSRVITPLMRLIRTAPEWAPAARFSVAISALETLLSAVITTWPPVASVYQEMPSTPDRPTALFTAASVAAPYVRDAAFAAAGWTNRQRAIAAAATASSRPAGPRAWMGVILTAPPQRARRDSGGSRQ